MSLPADMTWEPLELSRPSNVEMQVWRETARLLRALLKHIDDDEPAAIAARQWLEDNDE